MLDKGSTEVVETLRGMRYDPRPYSWRLPYQGVPHQTVSGLDNPNARTQARANFLDALGNEPTVITLLGEVDTGFVIWYRAKKYGACVAEMLSKAVTSYQRLIEKLAVNYRVLCISTPLPTLADGNAVCNRKQVNATQRERTELTLQFNQMMRAFWPDFIDLDKESLQDGLVHPRLLHKSKGDHHYNPHAYADMLIPHLWRSLEEKRVA